MKKNLHKITQYVLFCAYKLVVHGEEKKKQSLSPEWVGKWENLGSADLDVTYNYLLVKTQWMFTKTSCISMYIYLNSKENKPANKYLILANYKQD